MGTVALHPCMSVVDYNESHSTADWVVTDSDRAAVAQGCRFDHAEANRVRTFMHEVCRQTTGVDAGKPFVLLPWQWNRIIAPAFGWKMPDGTRRFKEVELWVPKKNGKSTLMAAIALYLLIADREYNAKVYGAASDKKQAAMIFDTVVSMYKLNPALQGMVKLRKSQKKMLYPRRDSVYEVLAADGFRNEGLDIHGLLFDELHAQRDRKLFASLRYGSAARRQGIRFILSTAGEYDEESLWWERFHRAKEVQESKVVDINLLPCVYGMEPHEDPYDPAVWERCNPSWGRTVNVSEFVRDAEGSKTNDANRVEFLRYRLNYTLAVVTAWIPKAFWDSCTLQLADPPLDEVMEREGDYVSYLGIDLSEVSDLTAETTLTRRTFDRAAVTRDAETGKDVYRPTWYYSGTFWAPSVPSSLHLSTRNRYERWTDKGLLKRIPGHVIDYSQVIPDIVRKCETHAVAAIGVDRFLAMQFGIQLEDALKAAGLTVEVVLVPYTTMGMAEPTRELERLIYGRRVLHDGHAIMKYMFNNLKETRDSSGNRKLDKSNPRAKIDGFAALCLALYASMNCKRNPKSRYDAGGRILQVPI